MPYFSVSYLALFYGSLALLTACASPKTDEAAAQSSSAAQSVAGREQQAIAKTLSTQPIWSDNFQGDWQQRWQLRSQNRWGNENFEAISAPSPNASDILRVHYPADSASPRVSRDHDAPVGGGQFYADLGLAPSDRLTLSYSLRFPQGFDFVRGGKLPGLFGGEGASGGNIPNGRNGFSSRLMWRQSGTGEVYAYLPTSQKHGTSLGRGNWRFRPGRWHQIKQEIQLNQPGQNNGQIRLWIDGKRVLEQNNLVFRTVPELQIDGVFFSTFFGGGDRSWATPKDTYIDFANFQISRP